MTEDEMSDIIWYALGAFAWFMVLGIIVNRGITTGKWSIWP
jgi:hypothetical protein